MSGAEVVAKEITPAFVCCLSDLACRRRAASSTESARAKGVIRRYNESERGRSDGDNFSRKRTVRYARYSMA